MTPSTLGRDAAKYDAAGNLWQLGGGVAEYTYDAVGMIGRASVPMNEQQFVYTADDERVGVLSVSLATWTWTVRNLAGKPLRDFRQTGQGTQWASDQVWRNGLLLATVQAAGADVTTYQYHLDHLGTPRLITNAAGVEVARHDYYPFGTELAISPHESPEQRLKFTGHERDLIAGNAYTLDYKHARYYNPVAGRFLSVDPLLGNL